ncbi:unnamed protein product, partial [Rotaria sp. Silwood2]
PRFGQPRATTQKQDQQVVALAEQRTFVNKSRHHEPIVQKGNRDQSENGTTMLERSGSEI